MTHFKLAALAKLSVIGGAALIGLPFQLAALKLRMRASHYIPIWFHQAVCRALGVRIHHSGRRLLAGQAVLIAANHVSWLDISVIGATGPLAFVAKAEVRDWPGFGMLARLQRTVFVDRTRRGATSSVAVEMGGRLCAGEAVVLFAEGTTGDGSRILPFKSALFGAVREALGGEPFGKDQNSALLVQPLSIVYRGRHGLAEGRRGRAELAWAGDIELMPHLALVLNGGPIDVHLVWGEPINANAHDSRKTITAAAEREVRRGFQNAIRQ